MKRLFASVAVAAAFSAAAGTPRGGLLLDFEGWTKVWPAMETSGGEGTTVSFRVPLRTREDIENDQSIPG